MRRTSKDVELCGPRLRSRMWQRCATSILLASIAFGVATATTVIAMVVPERAAAAASDGFDFPLGDGNSPNNPPITQRYCENGVGLGPHLGVVGDPRWERPRGRHRMEP